MSTTTRTSAAASKLVTAAARNQIRDLASRQLAVPTSLQNPATATAGLSVKGEDQRTLPITAPNVSFTLCTWNVLAQSLINFKLYRQSPKLALSPDYRRKLHRAWIRELDADVLCLQEVDISPSSYWIALLRARGYELTAAQFQPGRHAVVVASKSRQWKVSRCMRVLLDQHPAAVTLPGGRAAANKSAAAPTVFGQTKKIGLIVELKHLETGRKIVCATAHLYWIPRGTYIRLRQHAVMLGRGAIQAFNSGKHPVVYAGDFNGLPDFAEYALLTGNRPLGAAHLADIRNIPSAAEALSLRDLALPSSTPAATHYDFSALSDISPDQLVDMFNRIPTCYSAYAHYSRVDPESTPRDDGLGEPRWTVRATGFKGTLDYVYLMDPQCARGATGPVVGKAGGDFPFRVVSLLGMMPDKVAKKGMPNHVCPSDHVPLMVKLALK